VVETRTPNSPVRILIVDDFAPWRSHLRSLLGTQAGLKVVAEAAKASDAISDAERLQPDVILLDISLPDMSGIKAAPRILEVAKQSKILFLSSDSHNDMIDIALSTGCMGYVAKADTSSELLNGIAAVLRGERFISRQIQAASTRPHVVEFYRDDSHFAGSACEFVAAALRDGESVIALATPLHLQLLNERLLQRGISVSNLCQHDQYISLDAMPFAEVIGREGVDRSKIISVAESLVERAMAAANGGKKVSVFGEVVGLLTSAGNFDAAMQLEALWSEIAKKRSLSVLCAYPASYFQGNQNSAQYADLCAQHSSVLQA
jgi:DNA-binding NarL/FixJ family response regulator